MVKSRSTGFAGAVARGAAAALALKAKSLVMKRKSSSSRATSSRRSVASVVRSSRRRQAVGRPRRSQRETWVPNAEYTRSSTALGRRPAHNLRGAWKLLSQNISRNIYSYRLYSQFAGTQGSVSLENTSTTSTTGALTVPLHMWEVTSAPNVVNGAATSPNVLWKPIFSDPTSAGTLSWNNSSPLSVEQADNATTIANSYPGGSDTHEWFSAKMIFYCPTTLPCRYQLDVVQLKDTRLVPDATTGTSQFACAFYQAMVKRFAYSPLEMGDAKYQKYLKVLHSQSFILNPKETTEAVNTIFREVSIFMRLNRRATYDWEDQDKMNMIQQDGQVNTDLNIKTQVHPRARIFLMVRAQARNGSAFSTAIHPSYDVVLRTAHSNFSS